MADGPKAKNQHYVPRSILKRFRGAAQKLHVCDLGSGELDERSHKDVCSEEYFYGEDQALEKLFQKQETLLGKTILDLSEELLRGFDEQALRVIKAWSAVQLRRTEVGIREYSDLMSKLTERQIAANDLPPEVQAELRRTAEFDAHGSIRSAWMTAMSFEDLAVKFVIAARERRKRGGGTWMPGFLVSDHPVVACNQLAEHHPILSRCTSLHGLSVRGIQFFLPLSSSVVAMVYDPVAYEADGTGNVCHAGPRDVAFINELQVANAAKSVFFDPKRVPLDEIQRLVKLRRQLQVPTDRGWNLVEHVKADGSVDLLATRYEPRVGARMSFLRTADTHDYKGHVSHNVPARRARNPQRDEPLMQRMREYLDASEDAQGSSEPTTAH